MECVEYHIGGYELLRDGTKEDGSVSTVEEAQNFCDSYEIEYDKSKRPIENLMIWSKTKEADDMHDSFSAIPNYEPDWVNFEWLEKFIPEVTIKPDWALDALFNKYNGSK